MRYFPVVLVVGMLAGCSTLPNADKIMNFGSAVEQSGRSLETIAAENVKVALLSDQEKEAVKYLQGAPDYKILVNPVVAIDEREFEFRREQLKALTGYGSALKEAADPKKVQDIKDASAKLASAVGTVIGEVAPGGAAITTPVLNVAGKGVGLAITDRYAREINAIIVETDPYVQSAIINLKRDFHDINKNSKRRLSAYSYNTWTALSEVRSKVVEPAPGSVAKPSLQIRDPDHLTPLYAQFMDANRRIVDATAAVDAAEKAESALDKIGAAHAALKKGTATASPSVDDLLAFSDDLAVLVSASKGK